MKLETFFEKFDLFAGAPDAVAKMRELVLRLAFSGGLTRKRPTDEGVPEGWESRTIESISASISSGFACSRSHQVENAHVHLRTHNISTLGALNFDLLVRIDPKMVDPHKASIRTGDILFNNPNSQQLVGKTSLVDRDYGFSNHITRIRLKDGIFPGFVVFYLTLLRNSGYFARLCTRWINQAAVNTDTLKEQTIPLPPLAEQKRIVAKVDELMALCDRLEAQQQERETRHAALARASLARFADAPTPDNLPFLFHPSYAIPPAALRKTILTLAVQGKLVPQDPNDGDAREMIERAMEKRQRTIKAKSLRRKELDESADLFEHADLPSSWCVERFANLVDPENTISYGVLVPGNDVPDGIPFVRAQDLCLSNHSARPNKTIAPEIEKPYARTRLIGGEILLCVVGSIGKLGVVPDSWAGANIARAVARIKPIPDVLRDYLLLVLQEQSVQNFFTLTTRTLAQPTLNVGMIEQTPIPIPPLSEQCRIVAKVEQLMSLVDALETQLATSRTTATKLLSALVAELTIQA